MSKADIFASVRINYPAFSMNTLQKHLSTLVKSRVLEAKRDPKNPTARAVDLLYMKCRKKPIDLAQQKRDNESMATRALLADIKIYLKKTGIKPTAFGRTTLGDPNFVRDLEAGRSLTTRTIEKVRKIMEKK